MDIIRAKLTPTEFAWFALNARDAAEHAREFQTADISLLDEMLIHLNASAALDKEYRATGKGDLPVTNGRLFGYAGQELALPEFM